MGLKIILGFDGDGASAVPSPVYIGRSGDAARRAMEKSGAARFEVFSNPVGVRKHNPRKRGLPSTGGTGSTASQPTGVGPRCRAAQT